MPPLKTEVFRCLNIDKIRFGNKSEQVSFSSLKSQGCKNIRHNIRFMSFAIPRRTSPPPPYDDWVSNALNLNIFAITDDKHVRRQSTKFLISMVILNFNVLRLRCFYWLCLMKIAIALKKRSQIGRMNAKVTLQYFLNN